MTNVIFDSLSFHGRDFPKNLLLGNIIFQYKRLNFGQVLSIFNTSLFERSSKFWAVFQLPLERFS